MASFHPRASRRVGALAAAIALWALLPAAASAQDCKPELAQPGEASLSRTLIASPSSLFAWKKAAKEKYGDGYDNWAKSADKQIACKQETGGRRLWTCTRIAKPCLASSILPGTGSGGTGAGGLPAFVGLERLQRGDKNDQVKLLQQYLNLHGAKLEADGNFGSGTERAVKDYQRKEGLTPIDGIAGRQTKLRLMERSV